MLNRGHLSTTAEILNELETRGVELWVEADRLRFRAPEGALTPDLRAAVTACKHDLIAALRDNARARETSGPLSYNQHALYFLNQSAPESPAYNIGFAIRIRSALDVPALRNAAQALVDRHAILRTTYELRSGEPVQTVRGSIEAPFSIVDAAGDSETALSERVHAASRAPFDLRNGPVVRLQLFTAGERDHVLLVSAHHIAADGWSLWMLLDEIRVLYVAHVTGERATLPCPAATYLDFVSAQRKMIDGPAGQAAWEYWRGQLQGDLSPLDLPTDRPRPRSMRYTGASLAFALPDAVAGGVRRIAREEGTTAFTVLLSAFKAVVSRYSGKRDVIIGTPVLGRSQTEFQSVVGDFVNSVALRSEVSGERTFKELVADVGRTVREAIAHGEYPFPLLVQRLGIQRDPGRTPIFQVLLVLQKPQRSSNLSGLFTPGSGPIEFAGLQVEAFPLAREEGQVDLTLELAEAGPSLVGALKYNTDLFDETTARRMQVHFARFLAAAIAQPGARLDALAGAMLAPDERSLLLDRWNETELATPGEGPDRLFEKRAAESPEAIAIDAADGDLTYAQLDARANRLAHKLRRLGVGPGSLVAIGLTRTSHLPVAVLAVLKAGGAYVPMDPAFPTQRIAWMLEDAAPAVLLTELALAGVWPASPASVLCVDDPAAGIENESADAPPETAGPSDLAYVIFTSGSTGRPKGVAIPRGAVTNFLASMAREPGCLPTDRLLAVTTLSFDIAVLEVLLPLVSGATVVLATREESSDGARLRALLAERRITLMQATPATWRMLREAGWKGRRGLTVLCGGEALPADLAEFLLGTGATLWNMYGPTETTVWSTIGRVSSAERITIGRPIANTRVYVLGPELQPVPVGVTGELWIGGAGLARGYHGQPSLTAERFVADPFVPGGRMYRTGDLARWTAAGELEHLGRGDAQVKVRGFRIELGDVESALKEVAGVRDAAAVALASERGDTRLIGCVIPASGAGVDGAAIRQSLRARLPEYMVPSAVVSVERLPQTANGKLDRRALAAIAEQAARQTRVVAGAAPATATEQALAAIWCELLGVPQVARDDSFFDLGGHSLLATQLMSRVRAHFGLDLPLKMLFELPALRAFAAAVDVLIAQRSAADGPAAPAAVERCSRSQPIPLSFSQERLWFLNQLDPENTAYSLPIALRVTGLLDADAFEHSCRDLLVRHEALRTCFIDDGGHPAQIITPAPDNVLQRVSIPRDRPGVEPWDTAIRYATEEIRRPFDLASGPLARFVLYRVSEAEHLLLINVHHIVADQWSIGILGRELSLCYEARRRGCAPTLPPLSIQFADFAAWQRETANREVVREQLAHWKAHLAGLEPLTLLVEPPAMRDTASGSGVVSRSLPADLLTRLKALSAREGVTLSMALLAAFFMLLRRYASRDDLAVGAPVANRRQREVEHLVGMFINMLVLRADVSGNPTLRELLHRVRSVTLDAYERQDVPFEQLVAALHPARAQRRSPLVQVIFNVLNTPAQAPALQDLTCTPIVLERNEPQIELNWSVEAEVTRSVYVEFDSSLYHRSTIENMLDHFERALEALATNLETRLDAVDLLTPSERTRLVTAFNETGAPYPSGAGLAELFERQVASAPDRTAVIQAGRSVSYAELNARANQIAHRLRALGVGPDVLVGVGLNRTPDLIAALLGVLKAGGAYVPLDPAFPAERLAWMLEDARPAVIITDSVLAPGWPASPAHRLCIDDPAESLGRQAIDNPQPSGDSESLAYVIFTSGSTGRPKGVQIPRRAVVNFLTSMQREPGITQDDVLVAVTTLSFDIAVLELFLPLISGAAVVLATRDEAIDGTQLQKLLTASRATMMQATPATWRMLIDAGWQDGSRLRALCGGEPMPQDLADGLLARAREVWNLYGPTETTVWSTLAKVTAGAPITIGRPIANTRIYILASSGELVPQGVSGELWIAGDGLARGYLGRDELTADRFVPDPFQPGERMYRTGDIARWKRDGTLEHLGRADDQVKIRGFRIELGEVEHAFSGHPAVRQAAAIAYGSGADTRLIAFVIQAGASFDAGELREFVRKRLPDYMVPSAILPIAALPQTANGKLDRRALALSAPDLLHTHRTSPTSGAAPPTPMEEMLMAIWAEVLGVARVGRDDDFFDLGGHSLLAAKLMKQLSDVFWVDLSVRMLFEAPTVSAMAAAIVERMEAKRRQESRPVATVAEINPQGSRPPFFFLHAAIQGDGFYCYNLARHLGEEQPMYALPPLGLDGAKVPPTIELMAAAQREIIRGIQPSGPYYLGGFCFAGAVALEVARQLREEGEHVELVVAVETRIHPPIFLNRMANRLTSYAAKLCRWSPHKQLIAASRLRPVVYATAQVYYSDKRQLLRQLRRAMRRGLTPRLGAKLRNLLRHRRGATAPAVLAPVDPVRAAVSRANTLAINGYVPQYYDGRVECMWAEAEPFETRTWAIAASDVRLKPVAGNHNTCVTTQVASLGGCLARALREAQDLAQQKRDVPPSSKPRKPLTFPAAKIGRAALTHAQPARPQAAGAASTKVVP